MAASAGVLIVDDDPGVRQSLRLCLESECERVLGVGTASGAMEALERGKFDVVLLDLWLGEVSGLTLLPDLVRRQPCRVVVITAFATFESAVEAMKLGAVDYLPKPFTPDRVRDAVRRALGERAERETIEPADAEHVFSSKNAAFQAFLRTAERAASADCVTLLRGESGTGKNVLARWMHLRSPRRMGPFATVHCPALVGEMMSSTLFGHRKGAFTGAVSDAQGKVQEAEGGTLFLDEVGDLNDEAQARLLRFLNDRTYERVGEARERVADVRIIAATNQDLEARVREGQFREDLLHRLDVITLTLPPLRERREDVLPLAEHWLRVASARHKRPGLTLSERAVRSVGAHDFPGNLRELRNAIERAVVLAPGSVLEPADLGIADRDASRAPELGGDAPLDEIEREHIARVIARAPSLEAAARSLGIDATTLQRKRRRYGLS
jgi:NtrC-family two-component system response regulator AlgB